ncbi:MAG: flagellar biosynthesis anti-sigma factor FlgM [Planctomycetota bacterium]|jgi:flagellar biosynthesis anti-sigma factor FlgM
MQINGFGEFKELRKTGNGQKSSERTPVRSESASTGASRGEDAVELSGPAKIMGKMKQIPDVRQARLEEIKAELDRGEYLTDERVRDGVRNLLNDL